MQAQQSESDVICRILWRHCQLLECNELLLIRPLMICDYYVKYIYVVYRLYYIIWL